MKTKEPLATPNTLPPVGKEDVLASGVLLRGKVLSRTRRQSQGKDGKARFLIELSVLGGGGVFVVQRWSDLAVPPDLPVVGADVELPIRVGSYMQSGVPKIRMVWATSDQSGAF